MEGFKTFTQALDMASEACSSWFGPEDHVLYEWEDLMNTAAVLDCEFSLAPECCYCVFPDGEIGILNMETREIEPLFLPVAGSPVTDMERGSFQMDPTVYASGSRADAKRLENISRVEADMDSMLTENLKKIKA